MGRCQLTPETRRKVLRQGTDKSVGVTSGIDGFQPQVAEDARASDTCEARKDL